MQTQCTDAKPTIFLGEGTKVKMTAKTMIAIIITTAAAVLCWTAINGSLATLERDLTANRLADQAQQVLQQGVSDRLLKAEQTIREIEFRLSVQERAPR